MFLSASSRPRIVSVVLSFIAVHFTGLATYSQNPPGGHSQVYEVERNAANALDDCSQAKWYQGLGSFSLTARRPLDAEFPEHWNLASRKDATCARSDEYAREVPTVTKTANPAVRSNVGCPSASPALPSLPDRSCFRPGDGIPEEISLLGKPGLPVARAREEVLEVLSSQNGCSEWFGMKDPQPALTFASLSFSVDRHGPEAVYESSQPNSMLLIRQPYVARATQDGGAHTSITINANGAFYRAQGRVEKEIGVALLAPDQFRFLHVGGYAGNTLEAQILTLLHEFGHIIDLLPPDADDMDGKSARNTDEVLRHCGKEIETRVKEARQLAKK